MVLLPDAHIRYDGMRALRLTNQIGPAKLYWLRRLTAGRQFHTDWLNVKVVTLVAVRTLNLI